MINVYTTSHRGKARGELKRAGIKPFTPKEFGGLIAANDKPREAAYVHQLIGRASRHEFARMYGRGRSTASKRTHKFEVGQKVFIEKGRGVFVSAVICENLGRGWYVIGTEMMGKLCQSKKHEKDIATDSQIRYEPG